MNTAKSKQEQQIYIPTIESVTLRFHVLGKSPLISNRLPEKARQELLLPAAKKNQAERSASVKHDVLAEYRSSVYRTNSEDQSPTRIHYPSRAFGQALANAA